MLAHIFLNLFALSDSIQKLKINLHIYKAKMWKDLLLDLKKICKTYYQSQM